MIAVLSLPKHPVVFYAEVRTRDHSLATPQTSFSKTTQSTNKETNHPDNSCVKHGSFSDQHGATSASALIRTRKILAENQCRRQNSEVTVVIMFRYFQHLLLERHGYRKICSEHSNTCLFLRRTDAFTKEGSRQVVPSHRQGQTIISYSTRG